MRRPWWLVLAALAVPASAQAGVWYYRWVCAGQCAPGQLEIGGFEGPFASEGECMGVRNADYRRDWVNAPGNAGTVTPCEETDGPPPSGPLSAGRRIMRIDRWQLGLSVGPAWRVREAGAAAESQTGTTVGIDIDVHLGRPTVALELLTGIQGSRVDSAMLGADAKTMFVVPLFAGLVLSPVGWGQRVHVRPGLSIAGGPLFESCNGCSDAAPAGFGFGLHVKAGVSVYFGRRGFSLDAVIPWQRIGNIDDEFAPDAVELRAPRFLVRVAYVARNP